MKGFVVLLNVACLFHITATQSDVRLPPTMRKSSEGATIIYNTFNNIKLECSADGTPAVRYEWKKNGFRLNTTRSNFLKGSDGTITIDTAAYTDEGYYQCFAKNQYGTALSGVMDVKMAFLRFSIETPTVFQKTVVEGMPFHIKAYRRESFPESSIEWVKRVGIEGNSTRLWPSERMHFAENGDLHFAYALPQDADGQRIYRSFTHNSFMGLTEWGGITRLTVTRNPTGNISGFTPTLAFSSPAQTVVALIGGNVTFKCFFYGYPLPHVKWTLLRSTIQSGRYKVNDFYTELTIRNINASDEGNCACIGSNAHGNSTHTFQILVEAAPKFLNTTDGPYNVNVTEGESVTFNCNAFAKPQANIIWLQNGQPIDADYPPKRFVFSNDRKSLTIVNVCRDCKDRDSKTDLMVIQCNASNVHGYAFAQGYLNVLRRTNVTIRGPSIVFVDLLVENQFDFQCNVTSDPSTPHPTVRWYKTEPFEELVRNEPPYIFVATETLVMRIGPKCFDRCSKYLGEYRCVGDNGYSRDNRTITFSYQYRQPPEDDITKEDKWLGWKRILIVGVIVLVLSLIGLFVFFCLKRTPRKVNTRVKDTRRLPNLPSTYEDVGYDSIGLPLEELSGNKEEFTTREYNIYEHIGYDSYDQILEETALREETVHTSSDGYVLYHKYESIDAPEKEAMGNHNRDLQISKAPLESQALGTSLFTSAGRPMPRITQTLDEVTSFGYLVPMDERTKGRKMMDQQQQQDHESAQFESGNFPKSNGQSVATNTYLDLSRDEVNDKMDPGKSDLNPDEVNLYLEPVSMEVNQYLDLNHKEANHYLDMTPKEVNQYLDLDHKEANHYLDMTPKEVNQYTNLVPNEMTQRADLGLKEVNQ